MSARRDFRKYLNKKFDDSTLKGFTEKVWDDMNVTMPDWPGAEGTPLLTVRVAARDFGPNTLTVRCMRIRFLQRFSTGNPAHHAESDCFDEYIIKQTAQRGFPSDVSFDDQLTQTLQKELRDLKDFFIKDVNKERIGVN